MTAAILLLFATGLCWVFVGAAVGHVERRGFSQVRFQILLCLVCVAAGLFGWMLAPTAFLPSGGVPEATWALVVSATLLCGVFNYLMALMMGSAMRRGPNAIVWAIVQSGLVYPFLMGWLVFGVPAGPRRLCGRALIVASVFLYATRSGASGGRPSPAAAAPLRQWVPAALAGMLFCGINQCCANLPSYLEGGSDFSATFRTFAIYFGLLAAALAHVAIRRARGRPLEAAKPGEWSNLAVWAAGLGMVSFLSTKFLTFPGLDRLERLDAGSMGYPVMVSACIIGFFPYGIFVLRERIDVRQAAGAVLGIAGILLGCL